jgi:hypothetical protein
MHVERLPSFWPNSVRAPLFALGNAPLLALLLFPSRAAAWLGRRRALLPVLAPAALAVCYPADARVEANIVGAMLSLVLLGYGPLQDRLGTWLRGFRPAVPRLDTAVALLSLLALLPTLLHEGDTYSSVLRPPSLRDAVATLAAFLAGGWLARRATRAPWKIFAVAALSAAIPWLQPVLSPILGRGAVLTSIAVFVTLLRRGESRAAIVAGVFGVALVSRQFESIPVLAVVCLASVVGDAVAAGSPVPRQSWPVNAALVLTLHVALAYLFRLGVQDGLDFGGMFWGAGAFNDPHVSAFTIGAALFFKYAMGVLLAGLALRPALLTGSAFFARACFAAFALRVLSLFAQFSLAGGSFWTAMRVIGDLPTAVAMCGGALAFVAIERMLAVRSGAVAHAPPDVAVGVPSS